MTFQQPTWVGPMISASIAVAAVLASCRAPDEEEREVSSRLTVVSVAEGSDEEADEAARRPGPVFEEVSAPESGPEPTPPREPPPTPRQLHFDSLVIDTHVDTPQSMLDAGFDITQWHDGGHLDFPRMRSGGLDAAFFSIWVDPDDYRGDRAFERALSLFNVVHETTWRYPEAMVVDRASELEAATAQGRLAILFGVEGAHALGSSNESEVLSRLHTFRALGARYMTITWSTDNPLGHSSTGAHPERGLTDLGRRVVEEMERIGMVVDVSHVSDQTFNDIMDIATRPVLASHSSARALSDHPRNMTDDMIRRVAENGGAICVNYFAYFLDAGYASERSRIYDNNRSAYGHLRDQHLSYTARGPAYRAVALSIEPELDVPDVNTIVDHILHIVRVGGPEVACLGSDFDGVSELPVGLDSANDLPAITAELRRRRVPDHHIVKILGGNVVRVLRAAEVQQAP